ncbi:Spc98 family-domain-containing protein [Trametes punicea]|nr:Spc98 family-domain-containing protein [Trametes punicea]
MEPLIPSVHDLDTGDLVHAHPPSQTLPELPPQFFIPRLTDKPQNPIMDTLRTTRNSEGFSALQHVSMRLPKELELLSEDVAKFAQAKQSRLEDMWRLAASERLIRRNQVLSWDALHSVRNAKVAPSPFLSEQNSDVFASARYHVRPPLQDPDVQLVYADVQELFDSLLLTVCGTSSQLHIWDPAIQKFVLRNLDGRSRGRIVIVGKDEVVSASLLQRFLSIGNLIRRLELLSNGQDNKSVRILRATPALHAFNHSISSILAYLRQLAEATSPCPTTISGLDGRLTALWTRYEHMEAVLAALAALCGRDEGLPPSDFAPIPTTPTALLSLIYKHLSDHLEQFSSRIVIGALAFVLTATSQSYFQSICASIGYTTHASRSHALQASARQGDSSTGMNLGGLLDDDRLVPQSEEQQENGEEDFPDFIGFDVAEVLSRAQRSLKLLRAADPGHPLLTGTHTHQEIAWVWTEEQIDNLSDGFAFGETVSHHARMEDEGEPRATAKSEGDVLSDFKVFDLPPGGHSLLRCSRASLLSSSYATSPLRTFLESFPPTLPSSTPTLAHLTRLILSPLVTHASSLSGALVARLLSPATHLHLHAHLVLLRDYLLLTSHAFKARLQDALFTDAEEVNTPVMGSRTYAARETRENARRERHKSGRESGRSRSRGRAPSASARVKLTPQGPGRRAIGLSPALTVGDRWPPGGTDLNFHLRTVIVDSLDDGRVDMVDDEDVQEDERMKARRRILEEGEWRLGFAIRDLPVGTGKEKWLNPLCKALDFLYMHYQPPHPLEVVIPPAVLSKYHRMFAFNLRLMRVENVVRTLFRLTRKASTPLFPTLAPANKLLLHFRFVAHAFIMALSSYVYDVAIGSNMDAFLARLSADRHSSYPATHAAMDQENLTASAAGLGRNHKQMTGFADVFELAERHSRVLDDILSCCLLRSGQKAVGDILRQCMEIVLELGILAGDLKDGHLEEYEAAPALEELWDRFHARMTTFVKVLKALVEKEADNSGLMHSDIPLHMLHAHRKVSGTTANLHQLLMRLDMSDWWTKPAPSRLA